MKTLITGANGYVSKHVIEALARDHDLVLTSRRDLFEGPHRAQTAAPFVRADLTDLEQCRRVVEGIDLIVHIGAINEPTPDTFRVNTITTYNLMEAAREVGVRRVVMASSNCALGHCFPVSGQPFPVSYLPFDEAHPSCLEDNYGLSKLVNEMTLQLYSRSYGFDCVALRLNWCWGPKELEWRRSSAYRASDHAAGFWGYVDMRDVAEAFRLSVEKPVSVSPVFETYIITARDTMADESSTDLLERFYPHLKHLGIRLKGHDSFFNWQKFHRDFGFEPRYSWLD
ncbi:MAG: NAD(P)-dependent oxidoreductase [Acidobacteria bacterium]|nr:NAD(P)-dependent oxidoreductase [Acidobacteriota bacterium]MCI0721955.1 NAD(P)-dependent oxidoreductase [Acidobacteriota bacterium]